jgi:hypothetical protein
MDAPQTPLRDTVIPGNERITSRAQVSLDLGQNPRPKSQPSLACGKDFDNHGPLVALKVGLRTIRGRGYG